MRQTLYLDFQQSPPRLHWSGVLLLVAGLILSGVTLSSHLALQGQLAAAAQRVSASERLLRRQTPSTKPAPPNPARAEQTSQANEVLVLLSLPWQDALAQIETTRSTEVSLLSIEPDMLKGLIRLGGEAKTYEAVLVYMKQLQQRPGLSEVVLQTHDVELTKPGTPTHFLITARWANPT